MKFQSLRSKLLISVFGLVVGSGLIISLLVTNRLGNSWHEATITQGEYLAQAVALEATNKILINDLMALQNLLNHQLKSDPSVAYLFVIKDGQILAHTFSDGFPVNLIGLNTLKDHGPGNFKRIVTDTGEHYHDIVWPIFSGKSKKNSPSKISFSACLWCSPEFSLVPVLSLDALISFLIFPLS